MVICRFFWNHSIISNLVGKNTKTQDINSTLWLLLFGWKLNKLVLFSTLAFNYFLNALLSAHSLLDAPVKCQCIWEILVLKLIKWAQALFSVLIFRYYFVCKAWTRSFADYLTVRNQLLSSVSIGASEKCMCLTFHL